MTKTDTKCSSRLANYLRRYRPFSDDGFSLLELVVAVGILLILTVGGLIAYAGYTKNARQAAVQDAADAVLTGAVANDIDPDDKSTVEGAAEEWNHTRQKEHITVVATKDERGCISATATHKNGETFTKQTGDCVTDSSNNENGGSNDNGSGNDDDGTIVDPSEDNSNEETKNVCSTEEAERLADESYAYLEQKFVEHVKTNKIKWFQDDPSTGIISRSAYQITKPEGTTCLLSTSIHQVKASGSNPITYAYSANKNYYAYYFEVGITTDDPYEDGSSGTVRVYHTGTINVGTKYLATVESMAKMGGSGDVVTTHTIEID